MTFQKSPDFSKSGFLKVRISQSPDFSEVRTFRERLKVIEYVVFGFVLNAPLTLQVWKLNNSTWNNSAQNLSTFFHGTVCENATSYLAQHALVPKSRTLFVPDADQLYGSFSYISYVCINSTWAKPVCALLQSSWEILGYKERQKISEFFKHTLRTNWKTVMWMYKVSDVKHAVKLMNWMLLLNANWPSLTSNTMASKDSWIPKYDFGSWFGVKQ